MAPSASVTKLLSTIRIGSAPLMEAEACLSNFESLSEEGKEAARPSTIEKVFPLVFGDITAIESSASFEELKQKPWSTNCWFSPRAILTPASAEQVSSILALVKFLGATFSVQGGGHHHNPGFTSNEGGVVIALSQLNKITISEDKTTAAIGPGLTWLDVYEALDPYGLTVTGGRVPKVGVPGLLLGGGLSFQNSEHGLSCAGVVDYEIVLSDSTIVHANATENTNLFWALKGGHANFGIVTTFTMATVSNKVWAEARLYSPTQNAELIEALMKYHEEIEKNDKATLIFSATSQVTALVFFYTIPVENPEVFNCYYSIPFMGKIVEPGCRTMYQVMRALENLMQPGTLSHKMRTMTSLPDLEMYKAAQESWENQVLALEAAGINHVYLTMVFQPIASSAIKACDVKGGNPLGLKAQNHNWFLILADYKNADDEETIIKSVRTIVDRAEEVSKKNGTYLPFKYANYSSRDQNALASYGAENLARLREIALKYDAEEIFQRLQNGGWLVSKA
ncbi:FAD-dependent monooxygenase yanF [Lachnellula suecica]|uniref:FAD-dependent monooxygenase yanF n=1 Tax=Lachnellula suecica TaxID=602035 RepID=A0A8T9C5X7_9HELO|nr:FAD-dependent monooxygenase yanF [Lachnellula suecica]